MQTQKYLVKLFQVFNNTQRPATLATSIAIVLPPVLPKTTKNVLLQATGTGTKAILKTGETIFSELPLDEYNFSYKYKICNCSGGKYKNYKIKFEKHD